jgi:23S rRNA (cytidine1920-2'-O)/16S rRNA (cytidine1409-2'-O)-methyltransferase
MQALMAQRADLFLVEHGYAASRAEARGAIKAGRVTADGKPVTKPAQMLREGQTIVFEKAHAYVSRGALKLIAALDHFGLSPRDRVCLDIGASTGGFTQVLLERGAARVYAIDVGRGQLHETLSNDPRVKSFEGVNARNPSMDIVTEAPEAVVIDVSFISLMLVLPRALEMATPGAWLVALVKPQFEVGREHVGKGGIVRDAQAALDAAERVAEWLAAMEGWRVHGLIESPIAGGDGNREYLLAAVKS